MGFRNAYAITYKGSSVFYGQSNSYIVSSLNNSIDLLFMHLLPE